MISGRNGIAALTAIAVAAGALWLVAGPENAADEDVVIPELSRQAERGQAAFTANCAGCHGEKADGTDQGPPLIHVIYHPGHHGDGAFIRAVRRGSRAHHWSFGDMTPVEGVSDREVADIIAFVRETQKANGIY